MSDVIVTIPGATDLNVTNAPNTSIVIEFPASNDTVITIIDRGLLYGIIGPQGPAGATGATGPKGDKGDTGETGIGIPVGGAVGQVLKKASSTNYDTIWGDIVAGVQSVNGYTGAVVLVKADLGLSNVDNTSDLNKPISTATQTALNGKQDSLGFTPVTNARTLTINGTTYDLSANRTWSVGDLVSTGSYANPTWLTSLAWGKVTGTPTTLSGYGITDAVPSSRTLTINGTSYDLSADRSWTISTATPTLNAVTTAGNTTTNSISVGGLTVATNLIVTDTVYGRINFGDTTTSDSAVSFRFTKNSTTEARLGVYGSNKLGVYLGLVGNVAAIYAYNYTANAAVPLTLNGFGGNVLINTTTDAGYKLDVNGTAIIRNTLTLANDTIFIGSSIAFDGINNGGIMATMSKNRATGVNSTIKHQWVVGSTPRFEISHTSTANTSFSNYNGTTLVEFLRIGNNLTLTATASITASAALAQGVYFNNTLVAAANNDVLVGLDINPTFTNGAFTGVSNIGVRVQKGTLRLASISADPTTAANGDMYYNTTSNTFKVYQGGAWKTITAI